MTGVRVGHVLADRYRLVDLLAEGAMGEVWRGRDDLLDRDVAVKVLRPELAEDESFLERFRVEARHAAAVRHPHVAAVHDYGEDPAVVAGGAATAFLVMDLVHGAPLHEVLADAGTLEPARVAALLAQVAEALGAAHAIGLVHRDIKPANLVLGPADDVTVTDFGIARAADAVPVTRTGLVMGTAEYLSPEQARGARATTGSDVYSLGIVAYELLAGAPPFHTGSPATVAAAHVHDTVPPLPARVPRSLADTVRRCLAKDPAQRPDVAALAERLRTVAGALGAGVPAPGDGLDDQSWDRPTDAAPPPVPPQLPPPRTDSAHRGATSVTTNIPVVGHRPDGGLGPGTPTRPRRRRRPAWTRSPLLALLLLAALLLVGYLLDADDPGAVTGAAPPVLTFHVERSTDGTTAKDGR